MVEKRTSWDAQEIPLDPNKNRMLNVNCTQIKSRRPCSFLFSFFFRKKIFCRMAATSKSIYSLLSNHAARTLTYCVGYSIQISRMFWRCHFQRKKSPAMETKNRTLSTNGFNCHFFYTKVEERSKNQNTIKQKRYNNST